MSATTEPKRVPHHAPSGGNHMKKHYVAIAIGGAVFMVAWMIWTFVFSNALLP